MTPEYKTKAGLEVKVNWDDDAAQVASTAEAAANSATKAYYSAVPSVKVASTPLAEK